MRAIGYLCVFVMIFGTIQGNEIESVKNLNSSQISNQNQRQLKLRQRKNSRNAPRIIKQRHIPAIIKKPGLYKLGSDIKYRGSGAAIQIKAPAVFNMQGYTIDLEGKGKQGILVNKTSDVTILNGGIRNGPFNLATALAEDLDIPNSQLCGPVACQTGPIPNISQAAIRINKSSAVVIQDILIEKCLYGICGTNLGKNIRIDHVSIYDTGLITTKTISVILPSATSPSLLNINPYSIGVGILLAGKNSSSLVNDIRIYNSMVTSSTNRSAYLCVFSDGADIKNCQSVSTPELSINPADPIQGVNPVLIGGYHIQDSQNGFIRDCEARGGTQHVEIERSTGITVTDFVGNDTNNDGIEITDCQYCSVYNAVEHRNNDQGLESQGAGFTIIRSNAITVQNATASNFIGRGSPTSSGFKLASCANCLIKDCVIVSCNVGFQNILVPATFPLPFTPNVSSNKFYANYAANNGINFGSGINDVVYVPSVYTPTSPPPTVAYPYNNIAPVAP